MKYAVIDLGSNTIRLNIYRFSNGGLKTLLKKKNFLSISSYIQKDGSISELGIEKLLITLNKMDDIIDLFNVNETYIFATAAIRNAINTDEIVEAVYESIGEKVEVISGEDEALYGYIGTHNKLKISSGLNVDIGGGSTELVLFEDNQPICLDSMSYGALSLFLKYVDGIIPSKKETKKMHKKIKRLLKESKIDKVPVDFLCGVGGTIRSTGILCHEVFSNESPKEFYASDLNKLIDLLIEKDPKLLRIILRVSPERFHTITPGIIILHEICDYFSIEKIKVSKFGVREGYLLNKLSMIDDMHV